MFIWEWSWWRSWIVVLVKKKILVPDWKFYRTLCRSQLTRREWTGRDRDIMRKKHKIISTGFCGMQCFFKDKQKKDGRDFKPDINKHTCTWSSRQTSVTCSDFSSTNKRKMEEILIQEQYPVFKRTKRTKTLQCS